MLFRSPEPGGAVGGARRDGGIGAGADARRVGLFGFVRSGFVFSGFVRSGLVQSCFGPSGFALRAFRALSSGIGFAD